MFNEEIEIALASNQKYFPGLLVTAYSIAKHASEYSILNFNILDSGLEDQSYEILAAAVVRVHPQSQFRRFHINEESYSAFPDWRGNKMAYVRFLLPELLPHTDFVIYTDVDCLWYEDISKIWARRNPDVAIQGIWDPYAENDDIPWYKAKGLQFKSGKYFCTGNMMMNLRMFREQNIIQKTVEFILKYPDVRYPDQTSLNFVVQDSVELLPANYNYFTLSINRDDIKKPVILHFANDFPWLFSERSIGVPPPYMLWWYQCYAEATESGVDSVLRQFHVFRMKFFLRFGKYLRYRSIRWPFYLILTVLGKRNWFSSLSRYCSKHPELV